MSKTPRSPLEWLRERRDKSGNPLISGEEYAAGARLRADFEKAQLQPRVTSSWTGLPDDRRRRAAPGAGLELHESVAAAKNRVRKALLAVGIEYANLLLDVCCLETGLTSIERAAGWPQRSGKVILQMALRQLARHYGMLPSEEFGSANHPSIRQWGSQDYRGSLRHWHEHTSGAADGELG
jgi:Domain of unknown function (DUF6456)